MRLGEETFLVRLFSKYFNGLEPPDAFPRHGVEMTPIIVTRGLSPVLLGMLLALARRAGFSRIEHLSRLKESGEDPLVLPFVSMHEESLIAGFAADNPDREFLTLHTFCGRGPVKTNPSTRAGVVDDFLLILARRALIVVCGTRLSIDAEVVASRRLIRELKLDFSRSLKIVRGTPFQEIEQQEKTVLSGGDFERDLRIIAESIGMPLWRARQRARRSFYEMAANPRKFMYWPLSLVARAVVSRLFTSVTTTGLQRFSEAARESTVVLVPIHRSHLDYILLGLKLYESNLNPPLVAAGVNLSFWPAGFFLRSVGAFFLKRDARGDRFHGLVLKRYVTYLTARGHLQEFFIEGGRSRSGKMRQPKLGLLRVFVEVYLKRMRKDILFVPVSIGYEAVVEDKVYGDENSGKKKQRESLGALLRTKDFFKQKYGEVTITFGEPVSIAQFSGEREIAQRGPEIRSLVSRLGNHLTQRIREYTPVSLSGLGYTALMMAPRYGLTRPELTTAIRDLADVASLVGSVSGFPLRFTGSLEAFLKDRDAIIDDLGRGGVVERGTCLGSDVFYIPGNKRYTAEFYKNSVIHLFFTVGLLSMIDCAGIPITTDTVMKFYDIFEDDFLLRERESFRTEVDQIIKALNERGILDAHPNGGMRYQTRTDGFYMPGLLIGSVQSWLWVYYNLAALPKRIEDQGQTVFMSSYKDFFAHLQSDFRAAAYLTVITRTESSSQSNLLGVLDSLQQRQIISVQEDDPVLGKTLSFRSLPQEEIELLKQVNDGVRGWLASQSTQPLNIS